jgi:general secretion pathway protein E/type IV pilus assembly protein PilB
MTVSSDSLASFYELSQFDLHPPSVKLLGYQYCLRHSVVVLGKVDPAAKVPVTVGMLDPSHELIVNEVSSVLDRPVRPIRLNAYEIRRAVDIGYGRVDQGESEYRLALAPVQKLDFDPSTPITAVLNQILAQAVHLGASDVHIETYEDDVDVRYRIDGVLHQANTPLSRENITEAISRLKILGGLDIAERRVAQDGRVMATFDREGRRRPIDFRLSVVPGPFGEDAVMRILDSSAPLIQLPELGMQEDTLRLLVRLIENPEGLILVTGPTGSGKTTTLYSILHRINRPEIKVLTAEDPIEYHFVKMCQKQVSEQMGFAAYARSFMRQNPDVILIGEIRDEETADVAMRAAQTGHLVFSTLHTGESVRTVTRLRTLGVDETLISNTLLGALAQRLVRQICPACKVECPPTADEAERLGLPAGTPMWAGRGCPECAGTGFRGRTGIYELFLPDEEMADMIANQEPVHRIRRRALEKGMRTLVDDALDKATAGVTSLREILRTVPFRIIERQVRERRELTR